MDIVVIALSLVAALLAPRPRALAITVAIWAAGVLLVAVGPAHNDDVHVSSAGFWIPWLIVLAICCGLVYGVDWFQRRRAVGVRA
jgi:predicted membrane protein